MDALIGVGESKAVKDFIASVRKIAEIISRAGSSQIVFKIKPKGNKKGKSLKTWENKKFFQ